MASSNTRSAFLGYLDALSNDDGYKKLHKHATKQSGARKSPHEFLLPNSEYWTFVSKVSQKPNGRKMGQTEINFLVFIQKVIGKSPSIKAVQKSGQWMKYQWRKQIIDETFEVFPYFGDFFRMVHRAIKIINMMDASLEQKRDYYGQLRSILPDTALFLLYYNAAYTTRGAGAARQMAGTRLFGDANDFSGHGQHLDVRNLYFGKDDIKIMTQMFAGNTNPGTGHAPFPIEILKPQKRVMRKWAQNMQTRFKEWELSAQG
jgi:hypothetical protein